jgi:Spy/CpxP family protein refolding chaperone
MKLRWVVGMCCVVLVAMAWVRAEDKPADAKPDKKPTGRLTQPWSKLSSLSDDQKDKIKAVHAKAVEEVKAIHDKETADIMALLTDEQKTEAKTLLEKDAADKKSKAAAPKKDDTASTEKKDSAPKQ